MRVLAHLDIVEPGPAHRLFSLAQGWAGNDSPNLVKGRHGVALRLCQWIFPAEQVLHVQPTPGPEDTGRLPIQGHSVPGITSHLEVNGHIKTGGAERKTVKIG